MNPSQWSAIEHFSPEENWGDPESMDPALITLLDRLRTHLGHAIVIHCGYEPRDGKGFHPLGMAVDCHAVGVNLIEFYIAATRFGFGGLGIYPWWHHPGLHLDSRPVRKQGRAIWGCLEPKVYVPLDAAFLRFTMEKLNL